MLAGVCGGLGRYFDLNPAFYRVGFVVLTLLGGAGILVYVAAVLVIPHEGKPASIADEALAERREQPWQVVGLGLAIVALAVLLSQATFWPVAGAGWIVLLILGLAVLWVSRGASRGRKLLRAVIATPATLLALTVAAVAVGLAWFDVSLADGVGTRVYAPATASSSTRRTSSASGTSRSTCRSSPRSRSRRRSMPTSAWASSA